MSHRCALVFAAALVALCSLVTLTPTHAEAFCGFYVGGASTKLYNNATEVVLLREGTKTVLSMQNNYEGPPEDFAMVVPVPVVLKEEEVKTLPSTIFEKIDRLASPRLVQYWERDPCYKPPRKSKRPRSRSKRKGAVAMESSAAPEEEPLVKVEAEFDVGEYNVVILSAKESNALESWLVSNKYNIPEGAAGVLKGYIEAGQYFFVAKVDIEKVKRDPRTKRVTLSPLRFHYDSETFALPVRLGLLNAKGAQDLIVHILGQNQRYEVANRPNAFIPTNLIVRKKTVERFGEFYAALFDYTLKQNPGAVVKEYSWQAMKCDPCPDGSFGTGRGLGGALTRSDIATLGGDVVGMDDVRRSRGRGSSGTGWVLTRLHARYTAKELKEDLVFKTAKPIVGGRGTPSGLRPKMDEEGPVPSSFNNFQGRYIMLQPWTGKLSCRKPERGRWAGPPSGGRRKPVASAQDTAFATRGRVQLHKTIRSKNVEGLPFTLTREELERRKKLEETAK
ncbi:MAG: DUF2330 domain-containing protein [Myxococcota bacterium]